MCRNAIALQQTLSAITASREVALDYARNFYELLYLDPEVIRKTKKLRKTFPDNAYFFQELLNNIVEKGAQFTEMQYLNALQLICKSRHISDSNTLVGYQQRLSDILGTKPSLGVTV